MKVFISYSNKDLDKAEIVYNALKKYKHSPWYFRRNVTLGFKFWKKISYRIRKWCDVFLYISTESSPSDGQEYEIAQALQASLEQTEKAILAIPIDNSKVDCTIDVFAYPHRICSEDLEVEFESIAKDLKKILKRYKRLGKELKVKELVK